MTTTERPRRQLVTVIQGITEKVGARGPYRVIETPPRPGLKWSDWWNVWDPKLANGFRVGDQVVLTLEQDKPKKSNPQYEGDYWWTVVGITRADSISPAKTPVAHLERAMEEGAVATPQGIADKIPTPPGGITTPSSPEAIAPEKLPGVAEATRLAGLLMPGEREAAIAQAHRENMAANEALVWSNCYIASAQIAAAQARISEDVLEQIQFLSMENIKKLANNFYLAIKGRV